MNKFLILFVFTFVFSSPSFADEKAAGIERAEGAKLSKAVGHYSRARQLLIAAIREFDAGLKVANPDVLIDSKEWKQSVNDRAEDLEKLISPQPKITKEGVTYPSEIKIFDGSK